MRDYHIHTPLCKHAEGGVEDYIEGALDKGIIEVCFTDHIPLPNGFDAEHRMAMEEVNTYLNMITDLRRKYRGISILVGIEVDYIEGFENYIHKFLNEFSLDLVVMSVHFMPQWPKGQWVFDFEYTKQTLRKQCYDYFSNVMKGIKTGLFDVVGHFDLIKRPHYSVLDTNATEIFRLLDTIRKSGMSIELNTSGLRREINETYPSLDIIELAVNRNIPIVLGSDAHKPEHVGYGFDELLNTLFQLPNLKLAQYSRRELITTKMEQPENQIDWSL